MAKKSALRDHNRGLLILSANEKLAAGKKLSEQEVSAVETAENERIKENGMQYWRAMPKEIFCETFGGDTKGFRRLRDAHGFPWPDEKYGTVDAVAALQWYRNKFAAGRGKVPDDAPAQPANPLADAKAQMAYMQLAVMRGELVRVEDAKRDQAVLTSTIRSFIETLPLEHQDAWRELIHDVAADWRVEVDGSGDQRKRKANAPAGNAEAKSPKAKANPRRVGGKVRQARDRPA